MRINVNVWAIVGAAILGVIGATAYFTLKNRTGWRGWL